MSTFRRVCLVLAVIASVMSIAALAPGEAAAASCSGQSHTLVLSGGRAAPGAGSTDDRFAFSVLYADNDGCSPDRVVVVIVGVGEFALSRIRGDLVTGATFGRSLLLPPGRWRYRFEASSGSGVGRRTVKLTDVDPSSVVVTAPTPKPTAEPSRRPTPVPTPAEATTAPASPGQSLEAPSPSPTSSPLGAAAPPASSLPKAASPVVSTGGGPLPRPMLALVVSTVGTLGGLGLFAILGGRLLYAPSRSETGAAWRRGRDQDRVQPGPRP